jgi:hypothetical protein
LLLRRTGDGGQVKAFAAFSSAESCAVAHAALKQQLRAAALEARFCNLQLEVPYVCVCVCVCVTVCV